jgi:DNA-binding transcriptional MocR family regulator
MVDVHITARALSALLGDWRGPDAAYRSLADRVRLLILDGRVPTDTRLPAERDLAERLGLSRTTVTAAYRELRENGYLESLRGSGSVARLPGPAPELAPVREQGALDFSKASMPASAVVAEATVAAAARLPRYLSEFDYDPVGLPELRLALAERYTEAGLPTSPDEIMVTLGAQHAIGLLARTMVARGDRALLEMPSYPHAHDALRAVGARLVPVTVTSDQGWDDTEMTQAFERTNPVLAYLMPDFHNPTGASMSQRTRAAVRRAAARTGTVLVIDETTADLSIDRPEAHRPFAADNAEGARIITIGSLSKTVWGGLRIGWIRADRQTVRKLVVARSVGDLGTPILEQLVSIELLPRLDDIIDLRRAQLAGTRHRVEQLLAEHFPRWEVPRVHGGLALWVGIGAPLSSQLALAARSQGLVIAAGPRFGIDGAFERFLRIPITYSIVETERGIEALHRAWSSLVRDPVPAMPDLASVV